MRHVAVTVRWWIVWRFISFGETSEQISDRLNNGIYTLAKPRTVRKILQQFET